MKIALVSSFVPFIDGGYRNIVEWLAMVLRNEGHKVEIIYLPHVEDPDLIFQQMFAYRWVDLTKDADRVICFRPPSHMIPHPRKIIWFIHHIRVFYDLWHTKYRGFPADTKHRAMRDALCEADTAGLQEAYKVFTNSRVVSERLLTYNDVDSEVLYPPIFEPERFYNRGYGEEIVCICRVEDHKRQHLLVEAMNYTTTPVKLRLCGASSDAEYLKVLAEKIQESNKTDSIAFENRWISEEEKAEILSTCLAAAYLPLDEDSYGYPSLEASHSEKAVISTHDAGGVLELVENGYNGFITEPDPQALATVMDQLYLDKNLASQLGKNARDQLSKLQINWSHVIERVLS